MVFLQHARDKGLHVIIEGLVDSGDTYHASIALLSRLSTLLVDHMGCISTNFQLLFLVERKEASMVHHKL